MTSRSPIASRSSVAAAQSRISAARASAKARWAIEVQSYEAIHELAAQADPVTVAAIDTELSELEKSTRAGWPERRLIQTRKNDDGSTSTVIMPVVHGESQYPGFSRDSIAVKWGARKGRIAASLVVLAPYAYYVKAKQFGKNAYRVLIFDKVQAIERRLGQWILDHMGK